MKRERFEKLEAAFTRIVEAPAGEQARLLEEIAASWSDDPALRAELEALLEQRRQHPGFIETPALGPGFAVRLEAQEHDGLAAGATIGPYRIVRRIGAGGMGVVYEGIRETHGFTQRVAVKLIKRGMDTEEIVRRFEQERGVLARLEHPGIARLIDGGATEDGRPYLVMEYVEGQPLNTWCDERRLGLSERVRLFLAVCDAVIAAHRRLVVHRDLKPANILITDQDGGQPLPKLLDFGIAKVVDPAAASAATITGSDSRMMTPEYTAPEIIRGEPVSTAADVYSLGVILYEMLCGVRPFRLRTRSLAEAERIILESDARPPSSTLRSLTRRRGGALRSTGAPRGPDTPDTPDSPDSPDSPDTPDSGAATAVAAPPGAGVLSARDISTRRSVDNPERLRRRLRGDLDNIVLKAIQRDARTRYQAVSELADDLRCYLEGRPVSARPPTLRYRAAKFARRHWIPLAAATVAIASLLALVVGVSWQASIAIRQRNAALVAADQAERITEFLQDMIESVEPGSRAAGVGGPDVLMRDALDVAAARIDEQLAEHPLVVAILRTTLGRAYTSLGEYTEGVRELREALELYQSHTGPHSPETAAALGELGTALYFHQEYEEAESLLRQSLEVSRLAHGPRSVETAQALNNLAAVVRNRPTIPGAFDEARRYHEEALEIRREQLGELHLDTAESLNNLSATLRSVGDLDGARRHLEASLAIRRQLLPPEHPLLIQSEGNLATLLFQTGHPDEAEPRYRDVIARMEAALGPEHPDITFPKMHLARLLRQSERPDEAETLLREAEASLSRALHPGDYRLALAQTELASLLTDAARYAEAEAVLNALERDLQHPDADRSRAAPLLRARFIQLYEAWDRPEDADRYRDAQPSKPPPASPRAAPSSPESPG